MAAPSDRDTKPEAPDEFPPFTYHLASDVTITGRLTFPCNARVDGRFSGELKADALLVVGSSALIQANVSADRLVVFGTLRGNVRKSGTVELRPGATLVGDIEVAKLIVHEGARFDGRCSMSGAGHRAPRAVDGDAPAKLRQA